MSVEDTERRAPLRLGVVLFLVSVTVMFTAALVAYAVTRTAQSEWVSAGVPPGLYASTGLIGLVSLGMHAARRSVEQNQLGRAHRYVHLTTALALVFVGVQALNWLSIHRTEHVSQTLYAATFYMLTGLHALHVLGGVIPLLVVAFRIRREEYSSSRAEPVRLLTLYWDFLAVVWLVLLAALWIGS